MVSYRFDSAAEFDRHVRLGNGLFYLPEPSLPGGPGSRVVVEIVIPSMEDDPPVLHGRVLRRSRDGVWLEASSARAAARWMPEPDAPRRSQRRLACDLFVEVQPRGVGPWLCRAHDLSAGGLRVATGSFETGVAGDEVALTLIPPDLRIAPLNLRARLCWAGAREAGLQLIDPPPELARVLRLLKSSWMGVIELSHGGRGCPCEENTAIGQRQP